MPPDGKSGPGICSSISANDMSGLSIIAIEPGTNFLQVVRGNLGRHADGDAVRTVDEQVRHATGQYERFAVFAVVIGNEIDSLVVEVHQHIGGQGRQPGLRIAGGGGRQSGDGAKIPLSVNEFVAQHPILGEPHERIVDAHVAVRMVSLHRPADDRGTFGRRGAGAQPHVVHGHEDAPLHRLQPIAHVGQRPTDDDAHRVGQIAIPKLVFDVERGHRWRAAFPIRGGWRRRKFRGWVCGRQFHGPRGEKACCLQAAHPPEMACQQPLPAGEKLKDRTARYPRYSTKIGVPLTAPQGPTSELFRPSRV